MRQKTLRRVATLSLLTAVALSNLTGSVAASTVDSLGCDAPESLVPLISLLDTLTELAFLAGIGFGVLGFSIAGLALMIPGEDYNRRGKMVAKSVLVGVIILLSANMVVGFLVNELGGVICS